MAQHEDENNIHESTTFLTADQSEQEDDIELSSLPYDEAAESATSLPAEKSFADASTVWTVIPICLIGIFVAHADTSLVYTSGQIVASEFNALGNASWLVTSYGLAQCASQPLYGKLSNIFGRRNNLVCCYIFFALGCFICAVGTAYWQVIIGRVISGIGGAGMTALVSVIIADLVPPREIAAWRSYVNIGATMGRSLGGPIGGVLTDTVGWRWSFLGQVPLTILSILMVMWKMPSSIGSSASNSTKLSTREKFKRIDFAGAFTLATAICCLLLILDFTAKSAPWYITTATSAAAVVSLIGFCIIERYSATEPILPLELLTKRAAWTSYLTVACQQAAQTGVFYTTPIYFQIAANTSVSEAGLHLVPAVFGNALGGISSGYLVSRTGRYKTLTLAASTIATTGYVVISLRWTGSTNWFEALYIFLGGLGMGIIQSTSFVHLAASFKSDDLAIAGTTLYLSQGISGLIGIQTATVALQATLVSLLNKRLEAFQDKQKIIEQVIASVESIRALPSEAKSIVIDSYASSFRYAFGASIIFAFNGLLFGMAMREGKL